MLPPVLHKEPAPLQKLHRNSLQTNPIPATSQHPPSTAAATAPRKERLGMAEAGLLTAARWLFPADTAASAQAQGVLPLPSPAAEQGKDLSRRNLSRMGLSAQVSQVGCFFLWRRRREQHFQSSLLQTQQELTMPALLGDSAVEAARCNSPLDTDSFNSLSVSTNFGTSTFPGSDPCQTFGKTILKSTSHQLRQQQISLRVECIKPPGAAGSIPAFNGQNKPLW